MSVKDFRLEACELVAPLSETVGVPVKEPTLIDAAYEKAAFKWSDFAPSLGCTETLRTLNEQGPQPFAVFPPLEARYFRLMALSTAQAIAFPNSTSLRTACGMWSVSFR